MLLVTSMARASIEFNGSTQYARSDSNIDLSSSPKMAIAFWMKYPTISGSPQLIAEFGTNRTTINGSFSISRTSGSLNVSVHGNVGDNGWSTPELGTNSWHHYVFNFDFSLPGSEIPTVYIDGNLGIGTIGATNNNTSNFSAQQLFIGARAGTSLFSNCLVEGLTLWGGVNLDVNEVGTIYSARTNSVALGVETPNIKFSWPLQDFTGGSTYTGVGSITDQSGNGQPATPFNGPLGQTTVIFNGPQILPCADCVLATVQAVVDSARVQDIVLMPSCTNTWTSFLFVGKGIMLQGSGTNDTVIIDEQVNRQLAIIYASYTQLGSMLRISNFRVRGGITNTGINFEGLISFTGSNFETNNSQWRIDHIYFDKPYGRPFGIHAWNGLIDYCGFDQNGSPGITFDAKIPNTDNKGHRSWATPVYPGTVDAGTYIENCWWTNSPIIRACVDGFTGARYVCRNNVLYNASPENHGTESSGIFRSTRWMEVYANTIINNAPQADFAIYFRGGSGVVFSNTISGNFPGMLKMVDYRERDIYPVYGMANGVNVWDDNDPTIFATGTHTGTNNSPTLVDSAATWMPHAWQAHHIVNTVSGEAGSVNDNTSTNATFFDRIESVPLVNPFWNTGDTYEVRKVIHGLDSSGMGTGDLLIGGTQTPLVEPTPTTWPNQADDPIHYWNNFGITNVGNGGFYTVVDGRNYTNTALFGYVPLVYPHPFSSGTNVPPIPPAPPIVSGFSPVKNLRRLIK